MKKVLIASFDMEVGGVERSLISLLSNFDYSKYDVDLMLYRHKGDFMKLLPNNGYKLLDEVSEYTTFRKGIREIIKENYYGIGLSRFIAKFNSNFLGKIKDIEDLSYLYMQQYWKWAMPFLPQNEKEYDIAISYLWPNYFVASKVKAKLKIAWLHTDYSKLELLDKEEIIMWNKFNYIIGVSEECCNAFIERYPILKTKVKCIENIMSVNFIQDRANEFIPKEMDKKYINIVTVARLSNAKGIDIAIKACKKLIDMRIDIRWYVIGYGSEEEKLKELIKSNSIEENFILLGKKINPYPYIKQCDIYVQPSRYEGKCVAVTEAQILEKPVIITNYTTADSQVKNNYDGFIVDINSDRIAKKIEELVKDKSILKKIKNNLRNTTYSNEREIEKLYELMKI